MIKNKVIRNASWIIGIQIAKALIGIVISMLTARFFGPSDFGLINYASSVVAFAAPLMSLGLTSVLVQELVANPKKEGEILGTSIVLSFVSSFLCIGGVIGFVSFSNPGETETFTVCALYSILLVFQSLELMIYWFQAKLLSKYSSIVRLIAYLAVSIYKIYLLTAQKSVYWFAVSGAIDYMLIAFGLFVIYMRLGGKKLSFSVKTAEKLFAKSRYYIVSNMMITIFAQTDKIMLKMMIDDAATGYYAAAAACAGMTGFVFSAIIDSVRPVMFGYKKEDECRYEQTAISLYSVIIYASLLQSVIFTVSAPLIVNILYGASYSSSASVLRILVWYTTFSYLGGARDIWILAENKQKHLFVINSVGALLNVGLNCILIPVYGACGAAIASFATQFSINYVFVLLYKPTRRNGILQIKALNLKNLSYVLTNIRKV